MLTRRFFLRCLSAAAATAALPLPAFARDDDVTSETRLMMGTFVTVKTAGASAAHAADAAGAAFERMAELVESLTRHGSSPLGELNASGRLRDAPRPLLAVTRAASRMHGLTGGAFDPTVLPLLDLLERRSDGGPDPRELAEASELMGMNRVRVEGRDIVFERRGMKMSLDGIAKGYVADEGARALREAGVKNFLIDAGGDIVAQGSKNGAPWRVAVENPRKYRGDAAYPAVISLAGQALATSGVYENAFDERGELNHLINPATGRCAVLPGASALAPSAMEADALATALCVMAGPVEFMENVPRAACLIALPDGTFRRSSRWG